MITTPTHLPGKPFTRRRCLQQGLLSLGGLALRGAQAAPARPNILFIAVDDLRPELGCYGRNYIKSPNIDRIARQGMTFNRAYCQQAVCSPSRSSLLTGARPDSTKVWDLVTHFRDAMPNVVTLPQHFKQNGYFVQGMGKIFHPGYDDPRSWSTPWQTPNPPAYAQVKTSPVADDDKPRKNGKRGKSGPPFESADVPDNTFKDGMVAEWAVGTLRALAGKPAPFFLAVGFAKPHLPFVSPKKYWDLYDPARIKLAPNPFHPRDAPEYALTNSGELRNYQGMPADGPIPDDLARRLKHGYYAAISYTDAQIGKVLDELDRLDLRKNTIIVLWGDHGWKLGEHGEWAKHSNVENDANAPLLLSVPGMKNAGKSSEALVEFVDIYPTLSELAGMPLPGHLEGSSMKPLLDNPALRWKPAAFSQYPRGRGLMGYSMRTDRYRFTVWVGRGDHSKVDAIELYDHQADPQENTNIAKAPANAELVHRLMEQWRRGWRAAKPDAR
ncbi:MAG TPA: sulfatase [Bryobacteraceae bacterium]|jgi:arylsulfatase A-like enzyme|nr:sulfatase [Bryobacteraceae bacterium]